MNKVDIIFTNAFVTLQNREAGCKLDLAVRVKLINAYVRTFGSPHISSYLVTVQAEVDHILADNDHSRKVTG